MHTSTASDRFANRFPELTALLLGIFEREPCVDATSELFGMHAIIN
jgi:hypothetical protein